MFLFVQNLFDSSLFIFSLAIHLPMLGFSMGIISRFIFLSYFVRCFSTNLIGHLSRGLFQSTANRLFGSSTVWSGQIHVIVRRWSVFLMYPL